jgi:hypothetical protein
MAELRPLHQAMHGADPREVQPLLGGESGARANDEPRASPVERLEHEAPGHVPVTRGTVARERNLPPPFHVEEPAENECARRVDAEDLEAVVAVGRRR